MPERTGILVQPRDLTGNFRAVFNPAVHFEQNSEENGKIHLFCRLVNSENRSEIWKIGLDANLQITDIDPWPTLVGQEKRESFGCEDPRIVEIDSIHYLTYTAVCRTNGHLETKIALASSSTLEDFGRLCFILPEIGNNKNGVLIGEKINGFFWLFHRLKPNIHLACSRDLESWKNCGKVMGTRNQSWDEHHIGMGAPPLKTEDGWLCFYHGADSSNTYRIGAVLFDLEKPWKLLARSNQPLLEPEEDYEKRGLVPNVVFTCGAIEMNSTHLVFYGAADRVVAAAEFKKKEIRKNLIPV